MYHSVRDAQAEGIRDPDGLCVRPGDFAAQMRFLRDTGYTTLTMRQVADVLAGSADCPTKPIALTFDDGERDFYEVAFPVLRSLGFVATAFVPAATIGDVKHMTREELRALARQGIEIGSHSFEHRPLSHMSRARQERQIRESRLALQVLTGQPVVSFSYPGGYYDGATLRLLRHYGFRTAVTVTPGWYQAPGDPYELCRVRVLATHDLATFARRVGAPPAAVGPSAKRAPRLARHGQGRSPDGPAGPAPGRPLTRADT